LSEFDYLSTCVGATMPTKCDNTWGRYYAQVGQSKGLWSKRRRKTATPRRRQKLPSQNGDNQVCVQCDAQYQSLIAAQSWQTSDKLQLHEVTFSRRNVDCRCQKCV